MAVAMPRMIIDDSATSRGKLLIRCPDFGLDSEHACQMASAVTNGGVLEKRSLVATFTMQ